ncbi:MAG: excisionase family DNA-binding protein [Dehalococcoidia bacterium]
MSDAPEPGLSVTAAARRLGVSRGTVWRMIADGELDAESVRRGARQYTTVHLPQRLAGETDAAPPRSRVSRLQDQVDQLNQTVHTLSVALLAAERDRAGLRESLRYAKAGALMLDDSPTMQPPRPSGLFVMSPDTPMPIQPSESDGADGEDSVPPPAPYRAGMNGCTHQATREELLAPVRELFEREARRRAWWRRLPVLHHD